WVGDFRGRRFAKEHILRLLQSVTKWIDREFDFWILTNDQEMKDDPDIPTIELEYAYPGWWSKIELHRPDLKKIIGERRTLYMDLDSHAVGPLGQILDYPGDLVMFPTGIPENKWKLKRKQGWVCKYQAATMLFTPGCKVM